MMGSPFIKFLSFTTEGKSLKTGDTKHSKDWSTKKSTESSERRIISEKEDPSNGFGASLIVVATWVLVSPLVLGSVVGEFMNGERQN